MSLILKLIAIGFLSISVIDGAFDSRGFDPWDYSADLPSGFFTLLRFAVTIAAAYIVFELSTVLRRPTTFAFIYGFLVILFQPFVEIEFQYQTWQTINLLVLFFMVFETMVSIILGQQLLRDISTKEMHLQQYKEDTTINAKDPLSGSGTIFCPECGGETYAALDKCPKCKHILHDD